MIVLKFPNYEERYDDKSFRYEYNRKTKLLKVINKNSGYTDMFRCESFKKKGKNIVFKIEKMEKAGVVSW